MLVSEAKVRIVFQSMNKVADFVKSGRRFHRKAGAIPEESLSSARCRCLFGQMPVSVLGEARLSGARSNRLEGLESHRVGDTGRQGYKKRGSFAGFLFYGILI